MRHALTGPWAIREKEFREAVAQLRYLEHHPEAFQILLEQTREPARPFEVIRGVAILPVRGRLFRRSDRWSRRFGETTYDLLVKDVEEAIDASDVSAILFEVDSPGGDALGLAEVTDHIFERRGEKPMVAVVRALGASAAYSIASAADQIVVARDSEVGSIGTILRILDFTRYWSDLGIDEIEIVATQSPRKNPDPKTQSGRDQLQVQIDDLAQVFVDNVARNRGVSVATVLEEFGQGDVFVGSRAVEAGLVNSLGTFDDVLSRLSQPATGGIEGGTTMTRVRLDEITSSWLRENLPAVAEELTGQGRSEAIMEVADQLDAADAQAAARIEEARTENRRAGADEEHARICGISEALEGTGCEGDFRRLALDRGATRETALEHLADRMRNGMRGTSSLEEMDRETGQPAPSVDDQADGEERRFNEMRQASVDHLRAVKGAR